MIRYPQSRIQFSRLQLHLPEAQALEIRAQESVQERLKAARARGFVFLVIQHIVSQFLVRLRRTHPWLSAVFTPLDLQLSVTRPQRVASLCAVMLTSMAANALFFGKSKCNLQFLTERF